MRIVSAPALEDKAKSQPIWSQKVEVMESTCKQLQAC